MLGRVEDIEPGRLKPTGSFCTMPTSAGTPHGRPLMLRAGLYHADRRGYTCVDHVVAELLADGEEHRAQSRCRASSSDISICQRSSRALPPAQGLEEQRVRRSRSLRRRATTYAFPGRLVYTVQVSPQALSPSAPRSTAGARFLASASLAGIITSGRWDGIVSTRRSSTRARSSAIRRRWSSSRRLISASSIWSSGFRESVCSTRGRPGRRDPVRCSDARRLRRSDWCAECQDQTAPGMSAERILSSSSRSIGFTRW